MGAKGSTKKVKKSMKTIRVLTLGISGSGKSTFAKQMKHIHQGFTLDEYEVYREIVHQNIFLGLHEIIKLAEKFEDPVVGENRKFSRLFTERVAIETPLDATLAKQAKALWSDPAIQRAWLKSRLTSQVSINIDYFMNHIDRISSPKYEPTKTDVMVARHRTTGQQATSFIMDGYLWNLIDVGGQRPERNKWDAILKEGGPTAIIFFIALDEYNVASTEELGKTKFEIAKETFAETLGGSSQVSVLLFLNKMDLFTDKIADPEQFAEFKKVFPGYKGPQDPVACAKHLKNVVVDATEEVGEINLHSHNTCALDTEAMVAIFEAVKSDVYTERLSMTRTQIV